MREYHTLRVLRRGAAVDMGGLFFEMDEGEIKAGDLYIAERNTGPHLLMAREVREDPGWVHSTFTASSVDIGECVKVREVEPPIPERREVYATASVG